MCHATGTDRNELDPGKPGMPFIKRHVEQFAVFVDNDPARHRRGSRSSAGYAAEGRSNPREARERTTGPAVRLTEIRRCCQRMPDAASMICKSRPSESPTSRSTPSGKTGVSQLCGDTEKCTSGRCR